MAVQEAVGPCLLARVEIGSRKEAIAGEANCRTTDGRKILDLFRYHTRERETRTLQHKTHAMVPANTGKLDCIFGSQVSMNVIIILGTLFTVLHGGSCWQSPTPATSQVAVNHRQFSKNSNKSNAYTKIQYPNTLPAQLVEQRQGSGNHDYGLQMVVRGGSDEASALSDNVRGVIFMTLASLSFSLMFLGVKLYSNAPTFTLVFYRSVVQAVLSWMVLVKEEKNVLGPAGVRGLLTLRAATGSIAVAAFYYAVQKLPLPDAITLQFTTPVFAALIAVPLLGESWKPADMIGALCCLTGVLMIARPSWLFGAVATSATANTATATIIGLAGAAFAAVAYVLVRLIGSRSDASVMVFYYAVVSALSAPLGSKLLEGSWDVIGKPSSHELLVYSGLGLAGFLGQLFTNMGLKLCDSAATATLVTNIQIVFAFLFEITILHESLSLWSIGGTALIMGYMAFQGISMSKKNSDAE